MFDKGDSVLVVASAQFRGPLVGVSRCLRQAYGLTIHLYARTEQDAAYYRTRFPDVFHTVDGANSLYETCRTPVADEGAVVAKARAYEAELGTTISALAVSDRHLGRGFALAGFGHPRSRISERTSYVQMLAAYCAEIEFWRRHIEAKRPRLIINAGKTLCVLARAAKVPVRNLVGARYGNYFFWAINEYAESPEIRAEYERAAPATTLPFDRPYEAYRTHLTRFAKDSSFVRTGRQTLLEIARYGYWRLRGYEKAKGYFLSENVKFLWNRRRAVRDMTGPRRPELRDIAGKPFVFFPLATEPETALQLLSPEYFYQLSAIAALARDLPAGVLLAVKEHHIAAGRRPADFYRQIDEFKNVVILDMAEPGFAVVREASVVATISGTAGFEAAVMGKPVIAFGRHNLFNFLPHVTVVTDETELATALRRALDGGGEAGAAAGQRFLHAVVNASFDLRDFQPWEPDTVDERAVADAFESLIASLPQVDPHARPAVRRPSCAEPRQASR